jgi:hypothetical protein
MKPTPVGTSCHPYLEDGKIKENGRMAWWRNLRMFREGVVLNVGRWFEDNIKRGVGNGKWEMGNIRSFRRIDVWRGFLFV